MYVMHAKTHTKVLNAVLPSGEKNTNPIRHRTCVPHHLAFCSTGKHDSMISLYIRIVALNC